MFIKNKKAQSLIETLIAVIIAASAVIGIASVGQAFLNLGGQSQERVIAINLVREGLEVVQAVKMSYDLDPDINWLDKFSPGFYRVQWNSEEIDNSGVGYGLSSPDNSDIEQCVNCWLCLEGDPSVYRHNCSSYDNAIFKRIIEVKDFTPSNGCLDSECAREIISTVIWREKGSWHSVSLNMILTDWRD